jgi:DNA-binding transcriptional MerR regulator
MLSPLERQREARFDLTGLCAAAAELLGSVGPEDQRVRALPDARTVRYYQSIGVVDRPDREGRDAVYGWRHLLQVVAVKRLQVRGEPLARIQAALVGVSTETLEAALEMAAETDAALGRGLEDTPALPVSGFVTRELAPGVLVVIDTSRIHNPDAVLHAIAQSIVTVISRTPHGGAS